MLNLNWLYKQVKYLTCKIRNTVSLDDTGKIDPSLLPASSGTTWGSITGTLTSQTDLNTALAGKATTASVTAKANSSITVTGTGSLTGGGSLAVNRTIDASAATKASLAKADSALQTSDLAPYAKTTDLSVYAKTATIQPSLTKADSALQSADLASYAKTADVNTSINNATKSKVAIVALTEIADPSTATAEDIATAYNNLLAALTA